MNSNNRSKDTAIKTLAIVGFTAVIVLGVWLAVQVVQLAPSAFSALASLADNVYNTPDAAELSAVSSKSVVNTDENFEILWNELDRTGTYTFTYECEEGVSLRLENADGDLETVPCGQSVVLPTGGAAMARITSTNRRFIDVDYTVSFQSEREGSERISDIDKVTVVNATIPQGGLVAGADDSESEEEEPTAPSVPTTPSEDAEEETPTTPTTPAPPVITPPHYTYTYRLPESNPRGFIDLQMTYLGVGTIDDTVFLPRAELDNDDPAAIRFAVKNIGTKTSGTWRYELELPNGEDYRSGLQEPLKPQEQATIVLGFNVEDTGTKSFSGEVTTSEDRSRANNDFSWSVRVTN